VRCLQELFIFKQNGGKGLLSSPFRPRSLG
jgi:hypothetical protein